MIAGQAETRPALGKPDSRDIDIYVARFDAQGVLDPTFGTGGIEHIDLSDGRGPGNTINGDQAWGLEIRPDQKLVVFGSKGIHLAEPARTDRDIVAIQLETDGDPDPTFGTGGVATTRNPGLSENPRHGLIQADGKLIATGYANVGVAPNASNRPFIYRFNANGTSDATFGNGGVATGEVGGPAPNGGAEVYGVVQQGDKYVFAGYGSRSTTPANGLDVVVYRFDANGVYDRTFGQDGLFTYNRANGADRARDITALADGRLVTGGSTETAGNVDGLILVIKPDGSGTDASVGSNGALIRDLGGRQRLLLGRHHRLQRHQDRRPRLSRGRRRHPRRVRDLARRSPAGGRRSGRPGRSAGPRRPDGQPGTWRGRPRRPRGQERHQRPFDQPRDGHLQADRQAQEQDQLQDQAHPPQVEQGDAQADASPARSSPPAAPRRARARRR